MSSGAGDELVKEPRVAEIAASSIRSGLAELELKSAQVLRGLENVKTAPVVEAAEAQLEVGAADAVDGHNANIGNVADAPLDMPTAAKHTTLLHGDCIPPTDILNSLENLIAYSDSNNDPVFPLPGLDDVAQLALISHSIVAYLTHLDRQHLVRVSSSIAGDTTRWLGALFRFLDPASSFHTDNADAILRAVRLAIVARCPGYLEGGIPALAHPCFYISENITPIRLQYACRQLGIPLDAIRLIPTNSTFGTMDLSLLLKQVQVDLSANHTPLMVVADVGASISGYVDNLQRMSDICRTHNIWLHATGHALAALACAQGPNTISDIVDSIVLNLGSWLGVPSLPIVLLHRQLQNSALTAFESDPILSRRLHSLSLWTSLQALGRDAIAERIHVAFQTCSILFEITSKCEGMRVVSRAPGGQSGTTLNDVINKPLDANLLFETVAPVVVFQFDGSTSIATVGKTDNEPLKTLESREKALEKVDNATYFDRLNSWLGQLMQRDCPMFDFEIIEHPTQGTCVRYCPLELGLGQQPPTSENLEGFAHYLEGNVDILRATIKHKATFIEWVGKSDVLRLVDLPEWAGMGGVRFVPEGWESILTDQAKTELNKLNADLVEALKSTDNAFSLGESADGLICVRFGMVTHETEVEELLDLVVSVGQSVQENSRVLDTMSEIVKKGIEAATADLMRETEEKMWQEGILRHVPVVGRVFNWWSPPPKDAGGIKGRSLNLTQGVVESTENIYRYHMQMSGSPHQMGRSPPTPMVQTPVISTANTVPPVFPEPTSQVQAPQQQLQHQAQYSNSNSVNEGSDKHTRNISQSSNHSSVPELVPVNANVIVNANPINSGK
ncbi:pyridoxal-dependent decarboxylase domain-containing protein 1 [Bactrocera tryoni]|uniref:pyridoxal-dependent decarboxylase domain-containing protein 1 n=1 Tax=Bactrocera tryoni TaxID=59916 RepID=UPI001A986FC6|nr:pyridoxal-dependent decarboxylase domain-containing protein 1 [Bactrocera tryoni]